MSLSDEKQAKIHENASTQINAPEAVAASIRDLADDFIPDSALAGDGRVDDLHVTVKYGVSEDVEKLRSILAGYTPFSVTLGNVIVFDPSDSSDGVAPVVVEIHADELTSLHEAVAEAIGTLPDTFPYTPHMTLAYIKPEESAHYAGSDTFSGITFEATSVTLSQKDDHKQIQIPLKKTAVALRKGIPDPGLINSLSYRIVEEESYGQTVGSAVAEDSTGKVLAKITFIVGETGEISLVNFTTEKWVANRGILLHLAKMLKNEYRISGFGEKARGALLRDGGSSAIFSEDKRSAASPKVAPEIPQVQAEIPQAGEDEDEIERDADAVQEPVPEEKEQDEQEQDERDGPQKAKLPLPESPKGWRAPKKPVVETTNFKKWFGKSKVVDEDGAPLRVYHGTTHEIETFDLNKTNTENFYGQGFYFSSSSYDVENNYATDTGSDITNRIERLAEQIENRLLDTDTDADREKIREEAHEQAREQIVGTNQGATYPVYLSMKNPVVVQKGGGTWFEISYDEDTDESSGTGVKLYNALNEVASSWGVEAGDIWSEVFNDSFNAWDFEQVVRRNDSIEDGDGNINPGQFVAEIYQEAGFDGVIQNAWNEFGGGSKYKKMEMEYDTKHYIVWNSSQIKSAIGNRGKFDPKQPGITAARKPKALPIPNTLFEDCWITPNGKWIDCGENDHDTVAASLGFYGKEPQRLAMDAGYVRVVVWTEQQEAFFMFKDAADAVKRACELLKRLPVTIQNVGIESGRGNYTSYELAEAEEKFCGGFSVQGSEKIQAWHGTDLPKPPTHNAIYFAEDLDDAKDYGANVFSASLTPRKILKPDERYVLNKVLKPVLLNQKGLGLNDLVTGTGVQWSYLAEYHEVLKNIRKAGYDGVYVDEPMSSDGRSILILNPSVIHWESSKTAGANDLGIVNKVVAELLPMLGNNLPTPKIKIVNSPRSGWLGRDSWRSTFKDGQTSWDETTEIEVQRSAIGDENTLRRVLAHELCHHADSLVNDLGELKKYGFHAYRKLLKMKDMHGAGWKAFANIFNAKFGADFVTPKSDASYAVEHVNLRPYNMLLWKSGEKIYFCVSSRITPKIRKYVDVATTASNEYKFLITAEPRFVHGATIGSGWSYVKPSDTEGAEKLRELWDKTPATVSRPLTEEEKRYASKTADVHSYYEGMNDAAESIISEYEAHMGDKSYRQKWQVVPSARLIKIWNDYAKTGFVRDEKGMDDIAWTVLYNIWKIHANTILCGHTSEDASSFAEGVIGENLEEKYGRDIFEDDISFFEDEHGSWRISDYALDPLVKASEKIESATTAEQKLQAVDHILNIVHARSDLSGWFVQGGKATLNQLAGKTAASAKDTTSMTVGVDAEKHLGFPALVLIRWERGLRWRQVLKTVKAVVCDVAGKRVPWRDIFIWASLWNDLDEQETGWETEKSKGTRVMYDILHNGSFVSVGATAAVGAGVTDHEASHKTPPMSDTTYRNPEMGEETNAYADLPEKLQGAYDVPPLKTLAPQMFTSALLNKAAAYAEAQNQVQHTNHQQTYGMSKALKSDPFAEETAILHESLKQKKKKEASEVLSRAEVAQHIVDCGGKLPVEVYERTLKGDAYQLKSVPLPEVRVETKLDSPENLPKAPIVLNPDGTVMDGNHRVTDARQRGETSIMALVPKTAFTGDATAGKKETNA